MLFELLGELPDPRVVGRIGHRLADILVIAVLATLCGATHYTDFETFGLAREAWLRGFLALPNGIPSHDTFGAVFARLDPRALQTLLVRWVEVLSAQFPPVPGAEVVPIDGKTMRRSFDTASGKKALHVVSAFAASRGLTLGQVACREKSNEITAIPEMLRLLQLKGCIVSIDAMGTQKAIAEQIRDQGGDYLLALKDNHPDLAADVRARFAERVPEAGGGEAPVFEETDKGHGRIETRRAWVEEAAWFAQCADWKDCRSVLLVESTRRIGDKTTVERRHYLSSLPTARAAEAARAARAHWSIEALHWQLDVVLGDDGSRIRKDHAPHNMAVLRRLVLGLLRRARDPKRSMRAQRLMAGWSPDYLCDLLRRSLADTPLNPPNPPRL